MFHLRLEEALFAIENDIFQFNLELCTLRRLRGLDATIVKVMSFRTRC